mmetsp:Transcript_140999/g.438332  ORF Transcript_140999/g.438332 Transcript_140999/m.438332 type:complete len:332 (-) Transcript_140999:74-1069(-)
MDLEPCGDELRMGDACEDLGGGEAGCAEEGGAAAAAPEEPARSREDPCLPALSLPAAAIKRAAKAVAPEVRFGSEAVAALHRVAQAFVCFATDRALHEARVEADKAKKVKGSKANPTARKTLTADHVMRFLSSDLPPIAKKLASLVPDLMPTEYKPAGVRLLEQLHEQEKAAAALAAAAEGAPAPPPEGGEAAPARSSVSLFQAFASGAHAEAEGDEDRVEAKAEELAQPDGDDGAVAEAHKAPEAKRKRASADGEQPAKKAARAPKEKEPPRAPPKPAASLMKFFGKPEAVATPARAGNQAAAAPAEEADVAAAEEADDAAPAGDSAFAG